MIECFPKPEELVQTTIHWHSIKQWYEKKFKTSFDDSNTDDIADNIIKWVKTEFTNMLLACFNTRASNTKKQDNVRINSRTA